MSFDGVFLHYIKEYLNETIVHARCEHFFYDDQIFYMHLYKQKQKYELVIDLHAHQNRIFIHDTLKKMDGSHPLLQSLNMHLTRSIITSIQQYLSDRVLIFNFLKHDAFKGDTHFQLISHGIGTVPRYLLSRSPSL